MRHGKISILLLLAGLSGASAALALDFRSLAEPAVLRDAPPPAGQPVFVIARQMPVEVVVLAEGWAKVRDASGGMAWLEKRLLSERRMVQVVAARAEVRHAPDGAVPRVFDAERDVLLELLEAQAKPGWARVRHRDGASGYVRVNQVWGL